MQTTSTCTKIETRHDTRPPAIPEDPRWPTRIRAQAMDYMKRYDSCTQSVLWAFMEDLGMPDRMVLGAAGAMQGGMMSSLTCGVHTAGLMVLGMLVGRQRLESGLDGMLPIIGPAQQLVPILNERLGGHSCFDMTGVDFIDLDAALRYKLSADHDRCVQRVGDGAEAIAELLQDLSHKGALFRC